MQNIKIQAEPQHRSKSANDVIGIFCLLMCLTTCMGSDVHDIINARCCSADSCYPSLEDIGELAKQLTGRIVLPHMAEYANQSHMYNTVELRYPRIIVIVQSEDDIKNAVLFAQKYNLHVTIRSSGHDYVGRSTWEGSFMINLSEMKQFDVNLLSTRSEHGELKVQTGLTWAEIYQKLDIYKRVVVGGSGHTVTPGGYTLGGGHSPISRSLGYAVDNVLEIRAVLADGRIATCTTTTTVITNTNGSSSTIADGDLFWAMRGGGGGTFGIVVYIVFKLHLMPSQMVYVTAVIPLKARSATFDVDFSTNVFTKLGTLIKALPAQWGGYWIISNANFTVSLEVSDLPFNVDISGTLTLAMNKFAAWDGTEETTFAEFIAMGQDSPKFNVNFFNKSSFWDYEQDMLDPVIVTTYLINTLLQKENITLPLITFFQDMLFNTGRDVSVTCTGVMLGGKTTEFAVDSTPLNPGYRTTISSVACGVGLGDPTANTFEQATLNEQIITTADNVSNVLRTFGNGMYFNEPTKNNPYWKEDFWGTNYDRLLLIKRRYDTNNFFTCYHCVGSDVEGYPSVSVSQSSGCRNRGTLFIIVTLVIMLLRTFYI